MFSTFGYFKGDRWIQRKYADRCTLLLNSTPSKLTFCCGLASLLFRGKQSTFVLVEHNFSFQVLELSLRIFDETLCMNHCIQGHKTQLVTHHLKIYYVFWIHTIYSLLGITQILNCIFQKLLFYTERSFFNNVLNLNLIEIKRSKSTFKK